MDKYGIDSHKLHYHVCRLADWKKGETTYPIYAEISPAGACNHRCTFCALDYVGYQTRYLDTETINDSLRELAQLGLKSLLFGGEGEPLLHRQLEQIADTATASGIDCALTTNCVLMTKQRATALLPNLAWMKVSLNAGTAATYAAVHRCKPGDFDRVLKNLAACVAIKRETGCSCTLGAQMLLLPENKDKVHRLAKLCKEIGLDYVVFKPYSQHPLSETRQYEQVDYQTQIVVSDSVKSLESDTFKVVVRTATMARATEERGYQKCLALPFWTYIDAGGNVWGCSAFLGDERFLYGNIYDQSFANIWASEQRRRSLEFVANELDICSCRSTCRMDKINQFLDALENPPPHVNFI